MGVIKLYHNTDRNPKYSAKKIIHRKYYLDNIIVEFIEVTMKNTNLTLSKNKFSRNFVD